MSTRGGKRPGSGRKALGNKRLEVQVKPSTWMTIMELAEAAGITPGQYIDELHAPESDKKGVDKTT